MKIRLSIALLTTMFILVACGSENPDGENNSANNGSVAEASDQGNESNDASQINEKTEKREPEEVLEEGDLQAATEEQLADAQEPQSPEEFLEMDRIQEEIEVKDYDMQLITDDPGTRVMVYMDDDEQVYKTIYIKRNALFKMIDLQKNEPVVLEDLQ